MLVLYVLFEERSYARALFEEYKTEAVNDLIHYNSVNKLNTGCGELSSLGANFYLFALLFYKTNRRQSGTPLSCYLCPRIKRCIQNTYLSGLLSHRN